MVDGLGERSDVRIAALKTSHRFGESIGALASAIRTGDVDEVIALLRGGGEHIEWIDTDEPGEQLRKVLLPHALRLREAAILGDASAALSTLDEHRLLCAHRRGPYGVRFWNHQVERWLTDATGEPLWTQWYAGQARTGDGERLRAGPVQRRYRCDGGARRRVARRRRPRARNRSSSRPGGSSDVDTMHAMTIHKSQGSQADEVTVLMPPEDSRLLTRELFYTAVTRAKEKIRVIGSEASVRAAVQRRAVRASGLARRLRA